MSGTHLEGHHEVLDAVAAEDAEQRVLQRQEEARGAGVALVRVERGGKQARGGS
jgi:hypothetical protein